MYVHTREVSKLTPSIYSTLYKLNFRKYGLMQEVLQYFYRNKTNIGHARVFWIEDGGKIVAWSIAFAYTNNSKTTAYFYTHRSYRRRGYASKLIKTVEKRYNSIYVHPHDQVASGFFDTIKNRKIRRVKYY
jgi:GNAT superfamily N-acetyltransferase